MVNTMMLWHVWTDFDWWRWEKLHRKLESSFVAAKYLVADGQTCSSHTALRKEFGDEVILRSKRKPLHFLWSIGLFGKYESRWFLYQKKKIWICTKVLICMDAFSNVSMEFCCYVLSQLFSSIKKFGQSPCQDHGRWMICSLTHSPCSARSVLVLCIF